MKSLDPRAEINQTVKTLQALLLFRKEKLERQIPGSASHATGNRQTSF